MADDPAGNAGKGGGEAGDSFLEHDADISQSESQSVVMSEMDMSVGELDERFSQQQMMITQLKEMVLAEEAARSQKLASSRLKIEKCASQLARIRDRAKTTKLKTTPDVPGKSQDSSRQHASVEIPDNRESEKASDIPSVSRKSSVSSEISTKSKIKGSHDVTKMLHQQIKDHKAIIAERAKNEKELEQALAKIQKQLEENQSQTNQLKELGSQPVSAELLLQINPSINIDANVQIVELKNKVHQLEATIIDLQETVKEKDSVIDSKTKAITLMTADLSKKGKNTLDLLDDTKEQMQKMQENFAAMETDMKNQKMDITNECEVLQNRIKYLEEANTILESERFKLTIENTELEEKLKEKDKEIDHLNTAMSENAKLIDELNSKLILTPLPDIGEEKGIIEVKEMTDLTEKIAILENLNQVLRQSNIELQEKLSPSVSTESSPSKHSEETKSKKTPKQPKHKGSQKYKNIPAPADKPDDSKSKTELAEVTQRFEVIIANLNKQILEKEFELNKNQSKNVECETQTEVTLDKDSIFTDIETSKFEVVTKDETPPAKEPLLESVGPSLLDSVEILQQQLVESDTKINKLSKELADSNKNMIKIKASHKTAMKQLQKSIDDFSKVSDANSEVVRLQSEVRILSLKVAELEEDKGNLQLHLVDYDSGRVSDSQLHSKLVEVEVIAEDRLKAIADLETQKFDLVQELHLAKIQITDLEDKVAELSYLESEHVSSEMNSVQMEEQVENLKREILRLTTEFDNLVIEKDALEKDIIHMREEKSKIGDDLDMYMQEMQLALIDKFDKFNTEKVSSAESIEIVEGLTQSEKLEMESYQKNYEQHDEADATVKDEAEPSTSHTEDETKHVENINLLIQDNKNASENLEEAIVECQKLKEDLDVLDKDKNIIMSNFDALETENKSLSLSIQTLEIEKDEINKQLAESICPKDITDSAIQTENDISDCATQTESSTNTEPDKSKNVKNLTKEVLRLKNQVKNQDAELKNLLESSTTVDSIMKKYNIIDLDKYIEEVLANNEEINEKLKIVLEEKQDILRDLGDSESKCNDLIVRCEGLQHNITLKESDSYSKFEEITQLRSLIGEQQLKLKTLSEEAISKNTAVSDYLSQITQLDAHNKSLMSSLSQYENEKMLSVQQGDQVKTLENNLESLKNLNAGFETTISDLNKDIFDKQSVIDSLKSEIDNNRMETKDLKDQINNNNKQITVLTKEKENLATQISELKSDIKIKDEELHEIKLQLRKESIEYEKIKVELDHIQSSKDGFNNNILELQEKCQKYEESENKYKEDIEVLDKKCKEQLEKLKKYSATLKKKTHICAEMESKITVLTEELQSKVSIIESHENTVKSLQAELLPLQNQCADLNSQIEIAKLNSNEIEIATLKSQMDSVISENSSLKAFIEELQMQINQLTNDCNSYQSHLTEKDNSISSLQSSLQNLFEVEKEIQLKKNEVDSLLEKLGDLQVTHDQYQSAHEAKLQEREAYVESLESELIKQKDKISRLEETSSTMEERRLSLERTANSLVTKLREKDQEYSESSIHGDELEKKLMVLVERDEHIQQQLKDGRIENETLSIKLCEFEKCNKDLQNEIDSLRNEITRLRSNLSEMHSLQEERVTDSEKMSFMENELKRINFEYAEIMKQKTEEYKLLETDFQALTRDSEEQRLLSKEQCDKLHSELLSQEQVLHNVRSECQNIKTENENLRNLYDSSKASAATQTRSDEMNKETQAKIETLESQFNNCFSQLQEAALSERHYKDTCTKLNEAVMEKERIIHELENKLQSREIIEPSIVKSVTQQSQAPPDPAPTPNPAAAADPNQQADLWKYFEDQIISSSDTQNIPTHTSETEKMVRFFEHDPPVPVDLSKQPDLPALNEKIEPKTAYVCGTEAEEEEGWGWENQEVEGLEEHIEKSTTQPLHAGISENINQLHQTIENLKSDNKKLEEELTVAKQKLGKSMKKLKDMKMKHDRLEVEVKNLKTSSDMNSLDFAIQDELSSQIKSLEEVITDIKKEQQKDKLEKESLLKRIDVLTSANERLLEMKEKNDAQIEVFEIANKAMKEKIKNLEWNTDFSNDDEVEDSAKPESASAPKVKSDENVKLQLLLDEQTSKLKQLEIDNEELELLFGEQSSKIKVLESNLKDVGSLEKADTQLQKQLENELETVKSLKAELSVISKERDNLQMELKIINDNNKAEYNLIKFENNDLKRNLEKLVNEYSEIQEDYSSVASAKIDAELKVAYMIKYVDELKSDNEMIEERKDMFKNELDKIAFEKRELAEKYEILAKATCDSKVAGENDSIQLNALKENIDLLNNELTQAKNMNQELIESVSKLQEENVLLQEKINNLTEENSKYSTHISEIQAGFTAALNQRGEEIAELWKQHLNAREMEFEEAQGAFLREIESLKIKLSETAQIVGVPEPKENIQMGELNELKIRLEEVMNEKNDFENKYQHLLDEMNVLNSKVREREEENLTLKGELQNLSPFIQEYHTVLNAKEEDNLELTKRLNDQENLREQLAAVETKLADIQHENEVELANMRLSFHSERSALDQVISGLKDQNAALQNQLELKWNECQELTLKIQDLENLTDGESKQLTDLRTALENQEVEIVELKENLSMQIDAYDKLNEVYLVEKSKPKIERHVSFSEDTKPGDETQAASSEAPHKAELDLALYMLYQRDIRCEELTQELMQLLEERDTLQLKLSDAIKRIEETRSERGKSMVDEATSPEQPGSSTQEAASAISPEKSPPKSTEESPSADDGATDDKSLKTKLSQLRNVGHGRDIRLRDERETRQKQMELLQRDLEHLPPEAAAKLREAHYTLSRDTQSTSTVLLNWLWGKTPPKVVHM